MQDLKDKTLKELAKDCRTVEDVHEMGTPNCRFHVIATVSSSGIWIGAHESSSFWLGICTDLKSRGVEDILIAFKNGLSGFSDAINAAFPRTQIQLCVIHQIRNSMKYVIYKEEKSSPS